MTVPECGAALGVFASGTQHAFLLVSASCLWGRVRVGLGWHAVGCLRHQTPSHLCVGEVLVGFVLFDSLIVDASMSTPRMLCSSSDLLRL